MTTAQQEAPPSPQTNEPSIDRARLLEQRDAIDVELRRLAKIDDARIAAEARLAELAAEAVAIDGVERAEWELWVRDPAAAPPTPPTDRRQNLARRRVALADDLASTLNAGKVVESRRSELNAELRTIARALRRLAIGDAVEAARKISAEQMDLGARLLAATHDRFGLIGALQRETALAVARDERAIADELARAADEISKLPAPEMRQERVRVEERLHFWTGQLA